MQREQLEGPPIVDTETLRGWLEAGTPVSILDVRPSRERTEWSIPGSVHVDAYDALWAGDAHALDAVTLPFDRPVVTVCAAGRTSLLAAALLALRGHAVFSLARGMTGWTHAWNTAEVPLDISGARVVQVRRTGKGCLSYVVGAGSGAVVIDPSVAPDVYIGIAAARGWTVRGVVDTHVHADHLTRSRALAAKTGARVYLPEQTRARWDHVAMRDGDGLTVDDGVLLTALRTPGHTGESTCFSLGDRVLFTGDTLFLGSVGRPDLESGRQDAERRGRDLYVSLRRILALPPSTLVLPGHTASPVPFDGMPLVASLAEVRGRMEILASGEEDFVAWVVARIPAPPPNHGRIIALNESGETPEGDVTLLEAGANRCAIA